MIDFELFIENEENLKALAELEGDMGHIILLVLESVGQDTIAHLRSHIGITRPPARKGEPWRAAHPGGWADITSNLANAYRFEIHANGRKVRWIETAGGDDAGMIKPFFLAGVMPQKPKPPYELILINDMEYAAALEATEGYFVLSGVTQPGGPVERALGAALTALGVSYVSY